MTFVFFRCYIHVSMRVFQLSSTGELDGTVNMEKVLSKHNGPKDLDSLVGKYLYIAVLVQEDTGTQQYSKLKLITLRR